MAADMLPEAFKALRSILLKPGRGSRDQIEAVRMVLETAAVLKPESGVGEGAKLQLLDPKRAAAVLAARLKASSE